MWVTSSNIGTYSELSFFSQFRSLYFNLYSSVLLLPYHFLFSSVFVTTWFTSKAIVIPMFFLIVLRYIFFVIIKSLTWCTYLLKLTCIFIMSSAPRLLLTICLVECQWWPRICGSRYCTALRRRMSALRRMSWSSCCRRSPLPSAMMDSSLLAACTLLRSDHTVAHLVTLDLQIYMFKMQNVFEESQCKFIR